MRTRSNKKVYFIQSRCPSCYFEETLHTLNLDNFVEVLPTPRNLSTFEYHIRINHNEITLSQFLHEISIHQGLRFVITKNSIDFD